MQFWRCFFLLQLLAKGVNPVDYQLLPTIPSEPCTAGPLTVMGVHHQHVYAARFLIGRRWKYKASVEEYFVELSTKAIVKQSELKKVQEIMERDQQAPVYKLHALIMPA